MARTLLLDKVAVDLSDAFRSAGIDLLVLKGPVLAHHFYGAGQTRTYVDVDLLVQLSDVKDAGAVLTQEGFAHPLAGAPGSERSPHADTWYRESDDVEVDLHSKLNEGDANPEAMWSALQAHRAQIPVGSRTLPGLDRIASAVVVVLHAAHHGPGLVKPLADLRAALAVVPPDEWREARALATDLGASAVFMAGLRLDPAGVALAATLSGAPGLSLAARLRASSAPPTALGLAGVLAAEGWRSRLGLLSREIWPTPSFLREYWPLANRGRLGVLTARLQRWAQLLKSLGPGLRAVRRARRSMADEGTEGPENS